MPNHAPLTNTLVTLGTSAGPMSSSDSRPSSFRNAMTVAADVPTVMYDMSDRFLTRPHAWPSGVSAGHTMPQCVLCS